MLARFLQRCVWSLPEPSMAEPGWWCIPIPACYEQFHECENRYHVSPQFSVSYRMTRRLN